MYYKTHTAYNKHDTGWVCSENAFIHTSVLRNSKHLDVLAPTSI